MALISTSVKYVLSIPFRAFIGFFPRGQRLTRHFMYRHLAELGRRIDAPTRPASVLSVSGSSFLGEILGVPASAIVPADYPEHNVLDLRFASESFDMVLFDQVLEHVEGSPQKAIDELHRVLRRGGLLVCATVLVYPIHGYPSDFWRFTPEGLKLLCGRYSEIIDVGGWGNIYVWFVVWLGLHGMPVPLCRWHPLYRVAMRNDENWKIVTWIVARK